MSNAYYETLGRAVWKGGIWYLKRRYVPVSRGQRVRTAAKRLAVGVAVAVVVGGAIVAAQRHGDKAT